MTKDMRQIHFQVEPALKERLDQLPWGMRAAALRTLTECMCEIYERHGEIGLGAVIAGGFRLKSDQIVNG